MNLANLQVKWEKNPNCVRVRCNCKYVFFLHFFHSIDVDCIWEGNIHHELMHVLGFSHQQNRKDRDEYVSIKWNNILPDKQANFVKQSTSLDSDWPYDGHSLLHYHSKSFTANEEDTIKSMVRKC